jgi:hypothetical protein
MAQPADVQGIVHSRYRWNGTQFDDLETVTVKAEDLPRTRVSADPASLRLVPGGPAETVVVTIRNDGPASALALQLTLVGVAPLTIEIEDFASSHTEPRHDLVIAPPRVGESLAVAVLVSLPPGSVLPAGATLLAAIPGNRYHGSSSSAATVAVFSA